MSPPEMPVAALSVVVTLAAVSGDSFPESVAAEVEGVIPEGVGVVRAGRFDVEVTGERVGRGVE